MKKYLFISILTLLLACKQEQKTIGNITWVEEGTGATIKNDDLVAMTYRIVEKGGKEIIGSDRFDDRPELIHRQESDFKDDLFTAMGKLSEGDSAIVKLPTDSLVRIGQLKKNITKAQYVYCHIRINKVVGRNGKSDSAFNAAMERFKQQEATIAENLEEAKIKNFIATHPHKLQRTKSGLYFKFVKSGNGEKAKAGDEVIATYTGKTLGGKLIETSDEGLAKQAGIYNQSYIYGPRKFTVGLSNPLMGFEESLMLAPKGTKMLTIIPSFLAFAERTYNGLPPFSPMVCELEIVDVMAKKK
jgi:FKBP-type peptidyl-prolyl cis-trans isomerase FkpA